ARTSRSTASSLTPSRPLSCLPVSGLSAASKAAHSRPLTSRRAASCSGLEASNVPTGTQHAPKPHWCCQGGAALGGWSVALGALAVGAPGSALHSLHSSTSSSGCATNTTYALVTALPSSAVTSTRKACGSEPGTSVSQAVTPCP